MYYKWVVDYTEEKRTSLWCHVHLYLARAGTAGAQADTFGSLKAREWYFWIPIFALLESSLYKQNMF